MDVVANVVADLMVAGDGEACGYQLFYLVSALHDCLDFDMATEVVDCV